MCFTPKTLIACIDNMYNTTLYYTIYRSYYLFISCTIYIRNIEPNKYSYQRNWCPQHGGFIQFCYFEDNVFINL